MNDGLEEMLRQVLKNQLDIMSVLHSMAPDNGARLKLMIRCKETAEQLFPLTEVPQK